MTNLSAPTGAAPIAAECTTATTDVGPAALVLASGKGGVGKSVLTVVLGSLLAQLGRRVLLLDGSQNLGNLHVLLGCTTSGRLNEVHCGELEPEQVIQSVAPNLWLLPSDSGTDSLYSLTPIDRARLHLRLSSLYHRFDIVLIDSGPSIEDVVRLCTIRASGLVVVTVAEPTALADAYALIKIVNSRVPGLSIGVLTNQAHSIAEGRGAFDRLATASDRFLDLQLDYLGTVPSDPSIQTAVKHPSRLRQWETVGPAAEALRRVVTTKRGLFGGPTART